jgi:hypothetical protein
MLEESGDELELELLRSVRADAMPDGSRRRILAGLGIAGALVTTTSTAASSLVVAGKMGLFKGASAVFLKWATISALAGLVPAGAWVAHSRMGAHDIAPARSPIVVPSEPRSTTRTRPNEPAVAPAEPRSKEYPAPGPSEAASDVRRSSPVAAQPVTTRDPRSTGQPNTSSLSDEVGLLQVARTALVGHDAVAALSALDRYKIRFPAGRLLPEATVLRIQALIERGDRAQAAALAERFESSNPKSPYADRIRSILSHPKG